MLQLHLSDQQIRCPASRTTLVATRFRVAVICPIIQVPHCIRVFFYFVWFVFINHIFQFYYELCTYCNILDIWSLVSFAGFRACLIYMCLTVYEFSFILLIHHIILLILIFVLSVTFWTLTYYKIWILLIIYCFIWNYWIIYFVTCLEVFWSVMS